MSLTDPPIWLALRRHTTGMEGMTLFVLKKNTVLYVLSVRKASQYSISVLHNVNCTMQFAYKLQSAICISLRLHWNAIWYNMHRSHCKSPVLHSSNVIGHGPYFKFRIGFNKMRRQTGCLAVSQFKLNQNFCNKIHKVRRSLAVQTCNCFPHLILAVH
jgi:hypothetical protein